MTAGSTFPTGVPLDRDQASTAAARASAEPASIWSSQRHRALAPADTNRTPPALREHRPGRLQEPHACIAARYKCIFDRYKRIVLQ